MNSMVVRDLLQSVIIVDVIGQTVTIHLAKERRLTRQGEGKNFHDERHDTSVRDCDLPIANAGGSVEGNIDIGNDALISVVLERNGIRHRQQRIGNQASANFCR